MKSPHGSGTAPFVLSVLDNAFTGVGHSVQETFQEMIALAQLADRGFQRFWMSEHHAMPGAAIPSPQLMVARLIGETKHIRLGAGGIMLPNHVPLVVAEQIGMLDALAPGRIDLGLGRLGYRCSNRSGPPPSSHRERLNFPHKSQNYWDSWKQIPAGSSLSGCACGAGPLASGAEQGPTVDDHRRYLDSRIINLLRATCRPTRPTICLRSTVRQRRHPECYADLPPELPTLTIPERTLQPGQHRGDCR